MTKDADVAVQSRHADIDATSFDALVTTASRAPSVHNSQPWGFRLVDSRTIELEVVKDRVLPSVDPTGREAVISCGAALHNLLLALRARGLRGTVTTSPDPDRPLVVASVRVSGGHAPDEAERDAIAAIYRRHTHRGGFDAPVADHELREALTAATAAEGCGLVWVTDEPRRGRLISVTRAGSDHERADPDLRREVTAWITGDDDRPDGVPRWALAPRRLDDTDDRLPDRFVGDHIIIGDSRAAGTLAVLVTRGEDVAEWLAAGQALQRMLLRAAQDWAFANFATSALESERYRDAVRRILDTADYPQMILEIGYSRFTLTTRRRNVSDLILLPDT